MIKMTKFIILVLIISTTYFARAQLSSHTYPIHINEEQQNETRKTIDLLEQGQRNIILSQQRDIALILGNTGSGKSTFVQWLFGDNEQLNATRIAGGDFIIVDGNRIGNSTPTSKTLFPELVLNGSDAYYDCPGFSDTRSTSHDIAITYFIKRVADHAKRVKLVFVINYSSVRIGVDRLDFIKLLRHATDLITNVETFNDSIALIATKVDNIPVKNKNGSVNFASDERIINAIAEFLIQAKNVLAKDVNSNVKYIQLVNVFLMKNSDGSYARIGIFRRPRSAGPLSKNPTLQKGKAHVLRILNRLNFVGKNAEDFGYTVSDKSKNDIIYLIQDIGITVEANLDKMGNVLLRRFNTLVENVTRHLSDFVSEEDEENVFQPQEMLVETRNMLSLGMRSINSQLVEKIRNVTQPAQLSPIIRSNLSILLFKIDVNINESLEIIANQGQYFDFLQVVSKKAFSVPKSWALNVENKAQDLSILNTRFINYTNAISENISSRVDGIFSSLGRLLYNYNKARVEWMENKLALLLISGNITNDITVEVWKIKKNVYKSVSSTRSLIKNIKNGKNLTLLFEKITKCLKKILPNETTTTKLRKYWQYLRVSNPEFSKIKIKSWAVLFEREVRPISNLNVRFEAFINSMLYVVNNRIKNILENTLGTLIEYYKNLTQQINYEINFYAKDSSSNPLRVQKLVNELGKGFLITSKLSEESSNVKNPIEMYKNIKSSISILEIKFLDKEMANVSHQINRLQLLLRVNKQPFTVPVEWVKLFRDALGRMTELRNDCRRNITSLKDSVTNAVGQLIEKAGQSIRKHYVNLTREIESKMEFLIKASGDAGVKVDSSQARTFRDKMIIGINTTSALTNYIENLSNVTALAEKISRSASEMMMDFLLTVDLVEKIEINCTYLNYLLIVSNESLKVEKSWVNHMHNTGQYVLGLKKQLNGKAIVVVAKVESKIENLIEEFAHSLNQYYAGKLNEIKMKLAKLVLNSTNEEVEVWKAKKIAMDLKNAINFMSNLSTRIKGLSTPLDLKSELNASLIFNLNISENFFKNVSFQSEILDFMLSVNSDDIEFKTPNPWLIPIQNASYNFSASLNDFIKFYVNETGEKIYSLIKNDLHALARKIIDHYERKILHEETDIFLLLSSLKNARNKISNLLNKNATDLFGYLDNILDWVTELNIDKSLIHNALKRYEYLEYMQAFSTENDLISTEPFNNNFQPFAPVLKFVNESHIWFTFLSELDEKFSQYDIQSDASRYNVAHLDDWGKVNKPQGISIDKNNFHQFLDKLNIKGEIKNVEITELRLKTLNNIFANNFRSKYTAVCESREKIVLRGKFIKFSDFINEKGIFQNPCPHHHSPNIDISAFQTIFVDRNFIVIGSQFNVSIKAPKWEVIGSSRSIILDGINGQPIHPERASDGREPGFNGVDGKAGFPGGSAGSFRGTGKIFVNGRQLRVSANGGSGGRGQHGGHGRDGSDGQFVNYNDIAYGSGLENAGWFYVKLALPTDRAHALGLKYDCNRNCHNVKGCVCTIYGQSGQRGGDGGNGGEGGPGGREGRVDVVEEGASSGIVKSGTPGLAGRRGAGGAGGKGGRSKKVKLEYKVNYFVPVMNPPTFKFIEDIYELAENGKPGK